MVHMKRIVLTLTLLLILTLAFTEELLLISPAAMFPGYADLEHIVIDSNGTIEPAGMPITFSNGVYRLTGDISNYSIYILCDNIVIDGAGFTLQGNRSNTPVGLIDAHGICIEARSNVTIENLNITTFEQGIWNLGSSGVNITNNYITGCDQGITFVSNNMYIGSEGYAYVTAMNNTIMGNTIKGNGNGIDLLGASYFNIIDGNIISENVDAGIYFQSGYNNITFNDISKNKKGVFIDYAAVNNTFLANYFTLNNEGVVLNMAQNNLFCLNNFINNSKTLDLMSYPPRTANIWDNWSTGNYWSEYNGTDENHDGIGDTPYVPAVNNTDYFPLITPYVIQTKGYQPQSQPFPTVPVAVASGASITVIAIGLVVYFKKRKRKVGFA
jgi:parallel beta-helix repeat protein